MAEFLPGETKQRIRELRKLNKYTMDQVADKLGVTRQTYAEYERGKQISSEAIIVLARLYDVSADFILGLSDVPEMVIDEVEQLGLSVEAATIMYNRKIDVSILNDLICNKRFCAITFMIRRYYKKIFYEETKGTLGVRNMSRNVIGMLINKKMIPYDEDMASVIYEMEAMQEPPSKVDLSKIADNFSKTIFENKECFRKREKVKIDENERLNADILRVIEKNNEKICETIGLSDEEKMEFANDYVKDIIYSSNAIPESMKSFFARFINKTIWMIRRLQWRD